MMTKYTIYLLAVMQLLLMSPSKAASNESIRELLKLFEVEKTLEQMYVQLDSVMDQSMDAALEGVELTQHEQEAVDKLKSNMISWMREEMKWEILEPMYIEIYSDVFSQEEIDALLNFYQTPVGQSFIKKQPIVIQKSMQAMQAKVGPMVMRLQEKIQESVEELESLEGK